MTNNKQQTAVEWLYNELLNSEPNILEWNKLLEQAKEMEKRQIIKGMEIAFVDALQTQEGIESPYQDWEQYYEQTYGGGEQ
jgi:hypothetical protein